MTRAAIGSNDRLTTSAIAARSRGHAGERYYGDSIHNFIREVLVVEGES